MTRTAWNKGKRGLQIAWNKGINKTLLLRCDSCGRAKGKLTHSCPTKVVHSEETKRKISEAQKGSKSVHWQGGWRNKLPNCKECGKKLGKMSSTYCQKCCNLGSRGSNWKGGITPKIRQERARFRQTIKNLVFQRDNYTCQLCYARNGNGKDIYLQVDHIKPWSEYEELRFSVDNCRTLCMACHYQVTFNKPMPENVKTFGYNSKTRRRYI